MQNLPLIQHLINGQLVGGGSRSQDVTVRVLGSGRYVPATPYLAGAARSQGTQVLLRATRVGGLTLFTGKRPGGASASS